jgi:hypothetical protein
MKIKISSDKSQKKVEVSAIILKENLEQSFLTFLPYALVESEEENCTEIIEEFCTILSNIKSIQLFDDIKIDFEIVTTFDHKSALTLVDIFKSSFKSENGSFIVDFDTANTANTL